MKKILIYLVFMSWFCVSNAQNHPTGQRIVEDMRTDPLYKDIKRANVHFSLRKGVKAESDIKFIDNSTNKYFPPVISQAGGSCAYASGVGYIYNYEYNLANNLDSKDPSNIYNYLQVYAFLNGGNDTGGHCQLGWEFIDTNGVSSIKDYKTRNIYEWSTGYDVYYNGMEKAVLDYSYFDSEEDGEIEKMKEYLINHGNGSEYGGLIQFSAFADPFDPDKYNGPRLSGYDAIIPYFGNDGMHSMTIVGFDDTVEYDYNNDGNISEKETGAFICVNSWGESWGLAQGCNSRGRFYAPYYTFRDLIQSEKGVAHTEENKGGGTGNGGKACLILRTKKVEKTLSFKVNMKHSSRNDIKLEIGIATTAGATKPTKIITKEFMCNQGGDKNMLGKAGSVYDEIEFGVNASELLPFTSGEDVTYFLRVVNKVRGTAGVGEVLACSILDYRQDAQHPIEYLANLQDSKLNTTQTCNAIISTSVPKLEKGIDATINYTIDEFNKRLFVYINSSVASNAQIDLVSNNGIILKTFLSKDIAAGLISEKLDLTDFKAGIYAIRIVVGNRLIYKKLTLR